MGGLQQYLPNKASHKCQLRLGLMGKEFVNLGEPC